MTSEERANRHFVIYVISNYAMSKDYDFDTTRAILIKYGIVESMQTHSSPWISHNQKWREAKIDRALTYQGITEEERKELQNGQIQPANAPLAPTLIKV